MRSFIIKSLVVLSALVGVGSISGQCTASSVLWVSETVNANVGLASGSGRCNTSTVAGAAYDNPALPFGIQAAMDCACAGAEIRILAGVNNYGSASNSWNNRFDATKQVNVQSVGQSSNRGAGLLIQGYVDSSTPCLTGDQVNCPVVLDFTGGTSSGLQWNGAGVVDGISIWGLGFTGAAVHGAVLSSSRTFAFASAGYDNGSNGIQLDGNSQMADIHAYSNGVSGVLVNGYAWLLEVHNNTSNGYVNNAAGLGASDRVVSYDNGASGLATISGATIVNVHYTSYSNTGDGFGGATGNKFNAGLFAAVAVDNGQWAGIDYVAAGGYMSLFACLASTNNASGDYSPAGTPREAGAFYNIDNGAGISYPAAPDFTATTQVCQVADSCGFTYYGSSTTAAVVPGAAPGCGGGITLQPVRSR